MFVGNIFRELDVRRAGLFFFREAERFSDAAWDIVSRRQLLGKLGDRTHHVDNVENLEATLLGFLDRSFCFLSGSGGVEGQLIVHHLKKQSFCFVQLFSSTFGVTESN